jgi:hypothetical protein
MFGWYLAFILNIPMPIGAVQVLYWSATHAAAPMQDKYWNIRRQAKFVLNFAYALICKYSVSRFYVPYGNNFSTIIPQQDVRSDATTEPVAHDQTKFEALFNSITSYSRYVLPPHIRCKCEVD